MRNKNMKRILSIRLYITSMMTLNLYAKKESKETKESNLILDTIKLYDKSREREIPIAIYKAKNDTINSKNKMVIFSHGYAKNYPKNYLNYFYLTESLASNGYFVVSIQHELPI